MKKLLWNSLYISLIAGITVSQAHALQLNAHRGLTLEQIEKVAKTNETVSLDAQSWQNIAQGHQVIMNAALSNMPVYGLTVGVGWNKDKPVFKEINGKKIVSDELLEMSRNFNRSSMRAHAAALGEPLPTEVVRAGMLIRLNTMLNGETGVQPAVAQAYLDFLNHGITPIVPSRGTVGEADITMASHIGLALMGEWDVMYQGKRLPAKDVMAQLGIKPLQPVGKDFLSILSTNSILAGEATLNALEAERLYKKEVVLFSLMLEGYNGNLAPFSEPSVNARPFPSVQKAATDIRTVLAGSDLWKASDKRALQDPLSYRSMAYTLGNVYNSIEELKSALKIQVNHTDDNPLVLIHTPKYNSSDTQFAKYNFSDGKDGAIYPTSNFNFLPVVTKVEQMNQSLAKLAEVMTQQTIRMENPDFTKLSRFLAADSNANGHAFGAIQKPFSETNARIKQLAQPVSFSSVTLAGNIEDTATMSGIAINNSRDIINGIYEIGSFQLLHGTQAIDLRPNFKMSAKTNALKQAYRRQVPFITEDTAYTPLIEKGIEFLKNYQVN